MYRLFIIPIGWTIVICILCGLPGNTFPDLSFWSLLEFDKAAHAFVFALFAFLWSVAYAKQDKNMFLRRRGTVVAVASGILYGILIEILQFTVFVHRSFEVTDMIADATGCLIGAGVFRAIYGPVLQKIRQ